MDVQLAFDTYSLITYIISYIGKDETNLTRHLMECLKQVKGKPMYEQMKALKLCFVTHRQIGASEAVYRILPGLHLKDSNITCIFVVTGFPENRQLFFKPAKNSNDEPEQIFEDDGNVMFMVDNEEEEEDYLEEEIEQLHSERVQISDRVGEYQQTITNIERYQRRPKYLEELSLAQFATNYVTTSKIPKTTEFDSSNEYSINKFSSQIVFSTIQKEPEKQITLPKYIKLKSMSGFMRCRKSPCVLRTHSSKKKEGAEQFYAELLLFYPWRNEEKQFSKDLKECKEMYDKCLPIIKINRENMFPFEESMNLLDNDINLEEMRPTHLYDQLDAQGEQDNEDDEMIGIEEDAEFITRNPDLINLTEKPQFEEFKYPKIKMPDKNDALEMMKNLNIEQKRACEMVFKFCTESVISQKLRSKNPESDFQEDPLRLIVHGGAGKKNISSNQLFDMIFKKYTMMN